MNWNRNFIGAVALALLVGSACAQEQVRKNPNNNEITGNLTFGGNRTLTVKGNATFGSGNLTAPAAEVTRIEMNNVGMSTIGITITRPSDGQVIGLVDRSYDDEGDWIERLAWVCAGGDNDGAESTDFAPGTESSAASALAALLGDIGTPGTIITGTPNAATVQITADEVGAAPDWATSDDGSQIAISIPTQGAFVTAASGQLRITSTGALWLRQEETNQLWQLKITGTAEAPTLTLEAITTLP